MIATAIASKMMLVSIPSRAINLSASRLRVPSIKFRYGPSREQHQKPASGGGAKGAAAAPRGAAQAPQSGEAIYDFQLPLRFKRKPLSEEEIAHINTGGIP